MGWQDERRCDDGGENEGCEELGHGGWLLVAPACAYFFLSTNHRRANMRGQALFEIYFWAGRGAIMSPGVAILVCMLLLVLVIGLAVIGYDD